eukprot:CAMPEP_0197176864 /NCGR_PEP_ID=MMETSP1423-20130617/2648_1 /TAXON_ID=476441 /ORGANISM="Pseudo-nitzschia heimii, Strain UNC1101" /LENGTH=646 /DNA_ID=CAMNT_0042626305 /DNA_START=85 /DNA_END=2025 /DNA_ORIENTATION=-
MASSRKPQGQARKMNYLSHNLLTATLLIKMIDAGDALLLPIRSISMSPLIATKQHKKSRSSNCDHQINISRSHENASNFLFAYKYDFDEDQWGDDTDPFFEQESNANDSPSENNNLDYVKKAIVGGAALGTMMAINNEIGMSVRAETAATMTPASIGDSSHRFVESNSVASNFQTEVKLPYLENQIQAAEKEAFRNTVDSNEPSELGLESREVTNIALGSDTSMVGASDIDLENVVRKVSPETMSGSNSVTDSTSETTAAFSPSFIRYTQDHMPEWIEAGHKVYDMLAPKVAAGGRAIATQVDKRVMPTIIEKEHELLGEKNSAVVDKTLSGVASAGEMIAGIIGKTISLGIEGGMQVARATPEVVAGGQQVYKTMDEKILPELVGTGIKMKTIVDKTIPEVMDTGMHAYETIMPELMNAEKQVASSINNGMDIVLPKVVELENKIMPELSKVEHSIFGEEQAAMIDNTIAKAAQQGLDTFETVEKTIPKVMASSQKAVDSVAYTGRTVARTVPVMMETAEQMYSTVDKTVSGAISTTQDIASDLDRAAGKTAYAIEDNLTGMTGTIDKTLPTVLEAGRQAAISGSKVAKTVETGGRAIVEDLSNAVDDLKVEKTIIAAQNRFAATKPNFQEVYVSVNDPNQLGKL